MPPDSLFGFPDTVEVVIRGDSLRIILEQLEAAGSGADRISLARDIIIMITAIAGAVVAAWGLQTWKSQLKGRTEYELARRLLKAVYRIRETFSLVRNPAMFEEEVRSALQKVGKSEEGLAAENDAIFVANKAVYKERLRMLGEAFSDLSVEVIEAEVLWGAEASDTVAGLRECKAELAASLWLYFWLLEKKRPDPQDSGRMEEVNRIIYEVISDNEPDPFTKKIHEAVRQVEELTKPHLQV